MCRQSAHGCKKLGRAARSAGRRGCRLRRLVIGRWARGGRQQRRSRQGQEGRQGHVPGRGRRRLPRSGADLLHVRLRGRLRHAAAAVLVQARRRRDAGAGPRRGRAADLGRQQDHHGEDPLRCEVLAARQPRGHHQGHQVRVRARVHLQRALGLRDLLLRRHQGRPGRAGQVQGHPGHQDARRPDDRLRARQADGRHRRRRAGDADHDPGAAGVRGEVRPQEPLHLRPVHRLHGPLHGPQRRRRQGRRPRPRQADRDRPQPELGREAPTTSRPTSTRSASRRATTTSPSPAAAPSRATG